MKPAKKVIIVLLTSLGICLYGLFYIIGFRQGFVSGQTETEKEVYDYVNKELERIKSDVRFDSTKNEPDVTPKLTSAPKPKNIAWGGIELWEAVNKRRKLNGVNPLNKDEDLCTIASVRLNELLELGKLDGHEGFLNMKERRPDLKWIFEKHNNVYEFLALGGETPEETVSMWENTLGHQILVKGGEYVWGCIYAQDTFSVAITAY